MKVQTTSSDAEFFGGQKGIAITWGNDGKANVEAIGFTPSDGNLCEKLSEEAVKALQGKVLNKEFKPEYRRQATKAQVNQGN